MWVKTQKKKEEEKIEKGCHKNGNVKEFYYVILLS